MKVQEEQSSVVAGLGPIPKAFFWNTEKNLGLLGCHEMEH